MQKNGEIKDESARARTVKWIAKYVDQEPLSLVSFQFRGGGIVQVIVPVKERPECPDRG